MTEEQGQKLERADCEHCSGTGMVAWDTECPNCQGIGKVFFTSKEVKILALDLDMFLVDSSKRAAVSTGPDGKMDWNLFFDSTFIVTLDQPIETQRARVQELARAGYTIWYVTSREKDRCHDATCHWLKKHEYPFPENVVTRPKYVKTAAFKAQAVRDLQAHGEVVWFADDKPENRAAVQDLGIKGLKVADRLPWEDVDLN